MVSRPTTSCVLAVGAPNPKGYVRIWRGGVFYYAHRFAWIEAHGPIPDGLCVLHTCDNPTCVRVDHLVLGTRGDNNRDMAEKGRHAQQRKTACVHGHPFTPENTLPNGPPGRRRCRECKLRAGRERRARLWAAGKIDRTGRRI